MFLFKLLKMKYISKLNKTDARHNFLHTTIFQESILTSMLDF